MSGISNVSTAACFIDIATFGEVDSFLYGGPHAISYFVAGVQKANWFSLIPIQLRCNGTFDFGQESVSSSVNRSGDYVLNAWFRAEIPGLVWKTNNFAATSTVRWTRNLMHNLIKRCSITFNELIVEEFDNYWLDFNAAYRIPSEKQLAYNNMIGNVATMITPLSATAQLAAGGVIAGGALFGGFFSVVLPFWFGEDSGIALPVAALPFNDIKINYEFRPAEDLLVFQGATLPYQTVADLQPVWIAFDITQGTTIATAATSISFRHGFTHATYAVIHNDERTKMGDAPRDMIIRQIQSVCGFDVLPGSKEVCTDLRLSHPIVSFFFALRNKTLKGEWSNYTTNFDWGVPFGNAPQPQRQGTGLSDFWADNIFRSELIYENTTRLCNDSDYFSLIHPFLWSDAVSPDTGMHMYTYAIKPWDPVSPSGSTNYSKLANVQLRHQLSTRAQYFLSNSLGGLPAGSPLKLHSVYVSINWNIGRVANGSFGHPTL